MYTKNQPIGKIRQTKDESTDEKFVRALNLPRKHTEITIKTDDKKENAAFNPTIKFISCS